MSITASIVGASIARSAADAEREPSAVDCATHVGTIGASGPGERGLDGPWGLAVDGDGRILSPQQFGQRVDVFSAAGERLASWGARGGGAGEFVEPMAVAIDERHGLVYTADWANHRVQVFDAKRRQVSEWGTEGGRAGQFHGPAGIALDDADNVYVTDYLNHRVQKFSRDGEFVTAWRGIRSGVGRPSYWLSGPSGIAYDPRSRLLFVAEHYAHRISAWTTDGELAHSWGSFCNLSSGEGCLDPDGGGPLAAGDGQLNRPVGVAFTPNGELVVVDTYNSRVQVFDRDGRFLAKWGERASPATGVGEYTLNYPTGVAVDASGVIYVADAGNARIQMYACK